MATNYNNSIVTDKLVMCLDASDKKSYGGSGSSWKDRSGNGYDATLQGTVDFASNYGGELNYSGSQTSSYVQFNVNALAALSTADEWTIETMMRLDWVTGTTYFHSMATNTDQNNYLMVKSAANIYPYAETRISGENPSHSQYEKFLLTIVHKSNGHQDLYKNGVLAVTYSEGNDLRAVQGWVLNQEQDSVLGSFDANQATDMGVYAVRLYDKSLTADEALQNFNAQRGRFGI